MRRIRLSAMAGFVAVTLMLTLMIPSGAVAAAGSEKKVTVTFNGNCTATFKVTGGGLVHEWRNDPDCVIGAPYTTTGQTYQSMHVIFRPVDVRKPSVCPTGGQFYSVASWSAGDDPVLGPIFGSSSYNVCFYPQVGDLLDTVMVNPGLYAGTASVPLPAGGNYSFVSSGTWVNGIYETHDTAYATWDNWTTYNNFGWEPGATSSTIVNGVQPYWGAYDASHTYTLAMTNIGGVQTFRVPDQPAQPYYEDNFGLLTVAIYYMGPN